MHISTFKNIFTDFLNICLEFLFYSFYITSSRYKYLRNNSIFSFRQWESLLLNNYLINNVFISEVYSILKYNNNIFLARREWKEYSFFVWNKSYEYSRNNVNYTNSYICIANAMLGKYCAYTSTSICLIHCED